MDKEIIIEWVYIHEHEDNIQPVQEIEQTVEVLYKYMISTDKNIRATLRNSRTYDDKKGYIYKYGDRVIVKVRFRADALFDNYPDV